MKLRQEAQVAKLWSFNVESFVVTSSPLTRHIFNSTNVDIVQFLMKFFGANKASATSTGC